MSISIWRFCHLLLAVVSSAFLLVASATGLILALEPITHQAKGFHVRDLDKISLSQTIDGLKQKYDEVFAMEVESSGFVKASVLTDDFETKDVYIDPKTGEALGEVPTRPAIYSFATNLHRSLFLKTPGRLLVGFVSFLLLIITVTGLVLIVKRQGGLRHFFSKVKNEYFEMRYHVIVSRWLFVPIIILSATGVYLAAEKFDFLPFAPIKVKESILDPSAIEYDKITDIPFFKNTTVGEIRKVDFPFSDAPDDYYILTYKDKEIKVNQQTGEIVSTATFPLIQVLAKLSFILHTGEGSVGWSIILFLASSAIIFFIYSGFVMMIKRIRKTKVNKKLESKPEECEYIILVGSETGTTFEMAKKLLKSLLKLNVKACIVELNNYQKFPAARHFFVLTATYGDGEPPTNARFFLEGFKEVKQDNSIGYSVVGFGSLEYMDYCAFAVNVDQLFRQQSNFEEILPIFKINDANFTAFEKWGEKWSAKTGLKLKLEAPKTKKKKLKMRAFEIVGRTELNTDYTFLLRLRPKKKINFRSGDLLTIIPEGSQNPRQYSIAKVDGDILLSIKKHQFGKASNYLNSRNPGDTISAALEINPDFHLSRKSKSAVLIANGTGIAPFLGMVRENKEMDINLLWGTRSYASCKIYDEFLGNSKCMFSPNDNNKLNVFRCFSREALEKRYVQELVREQGDIIIRNFENDGICMICGSVSMQNDVLDEIDRLLREKSTITMDVLVQKQQLKMDCY